MLQHQANPRASNKTEIFWEITTKGSKMKTDNSERNQSNEYIIYQYIATRQLEQDPYQTNQDYWMSKEVSYWDVNWNSLPLIEAQFIDY